MTDESDQNSPETDAVRRLLAESRHDEPIPADVAARMDRVLSDLASSPDLAPAADPVVAAATDEAETVDGVITRLPVQRRRRAAALLAAAAAIVVGGVVFAQHLPREGSGTAATAEPASGEGDRFSGSDSDAAGGAQSSQPPAAGPTGSRRPEAAQAQLHDGRVVVRRQSFAADALAGQAFLTGKGSPRLVPPDASCPAPAGQDHVVPALYRRAPAVLVYHLPDGSTQVVDLLVCGTRRPMLSVTLPAP